MKKISLFLIFCGLVLPSYASFAQDKSTTVNDGATTPTPETPKKPTTVNDGATTPTPETPKKPTTVNDGATTPTPEIPKKPPAPRVSEKLIGTWETTDEKSGQVLIFNFRKDNEMSYTVISGKDESLTRSARYELENNGRIRLIIGGRITQTLYKVSGNLLEIQLIGQTPNKPYPTKFESTKSRKFIKKEEKASKDEQN